MKDIFDYEEFQKMVILKKTNYQKERPYPFAIFDNLFSNQILSEINLEINEKNFELDCRNLSDIEIKTRSNFEDNESIPFYSKQVFNVLNGGKFLNLTTQLTGIEGLISDPYFDGGGINIIKNNGTLAVHVDGTLQKRMNLHRRLNAILYLNEVWEKDWNGHHEQWEYLHKDKSPFDQNQLWTCVRKINPIKNRLIIFTTNDKSWHGHSQVLSVPENIQRCSLISYFYTTTRPHSDLLFQENHKALFVNNAITHKDNPFENFEFIP